MTRSKSGIAVFSTTRTGAADSFLAVLAAIVPRDDQTKCDVKSAEADAEQSIRRWKRHERRGDAEEHEADAHLRHDANGVRTTADERGAVRQHPHRRHGDRKSTRLNSSHIPLSRMPSSA